MHQKKSTPSTKTPSLQLCQAARAVSSDSEVKTDRPPQPPCTHQHNALLLSYSALSWKAAARA